MKKLLMLACLLSLTACFPKTANSNFITYANATSDDYYNLNNKVIYISTANHSNSDIYNLNNKVLNAFKRLNYKTTYNKSMSDIELSFAVKKMEVREVNNDMSINSFIGKENAKKLGLKEESEAKVNKEYNVEVFIVIKNSKTKDVIYNKRIEGYAQGQNKNEQYVLDRLFREIILSI
tara:strand:+ start:10115 stop:10648 length:534 start_codon:yes stop_codon:yes gene_type:complete